MLPQICNQQPYLELFPDIDVLVARVHQYQTQAFSTEIRNRQSLTPNFNLPDEEILRNCVELIAYSQQAQATLVEQLIGTGIFSRIFRGYDVGVVAHLDPHQLIDQHWGSIGALRFRSKITSMVACARALLAIRQQHPSFMAYLKSTNLLTAIRSQQDIAEFWTEFQAVQAYLHQIGMPFFHNLTSLCHLLMTLGFDCAKPDKVVMTVAVDLHIVPPRKNPKQPTFTDRERRHVIETLQVYGLCRGMRVPAVDLYLLICGGQTGTLQYVFPQFYPCP